MEELKSKMMKNRNVFRTISGVDFTYRRAQISLKINKIEETLDVYVVKNNNFSYELLLGLDAIKKFKLIQDENLDIFQKVDNKKEKLTQNNNVTEKLSENSSNNNIKEKETFFTIMDTPREDDSKLIQHLDEVKRNNINSLINKYKLIFAKSKYDVGKAKEVEAEIKLVEDKYVIKKPYRASVLDNREIESQIKNLLESGLIENSNSPYASPVTLAYKREENRRSRMCIDFRDLNKLVIPEPQPFPRIEDITVKA